MTISQQNSQLIDRVVSLLRRCRSVLFITGAGVSADSGLPTYRGVGGLYEDRNTPDGIPIEQALSGEMMRENPSLTWKYLAQIDAATRDARFNRAHEVIAEMEQHFERVWTLTQNVDGFHTDAGSRNVIEIHGNAHRLCCTKCDYQTRVTDYSGLAIPPRCPNCASIVRPDVVLFGEWLPEAECEKLMRELERGFDIVFTVGTTCVFPYISTPVLDAKRRGVPTVEINPGVTEVSDIVDIKLDLRAAEALAELWKRFQAEDAPS